MHQYNRIIELSLIDIPPDDINQVLIFLNQFPNLNFLHIHIRNQRISDEYILIYLNEIINKFHSLIYLKLQLDKDIDLSGNNELNIRIKMYFTNIIFEGVIIHIWF
jgi:hypothetical protein